MRQRLLDLSFELAAFPEVPVALDTLRQQGLRLAILSNGTPKILAAAAGSADVAKHFDAILSVEDVGIFKLYESVYDLVDKHFHLPPSEGAVVSSNRWDACAAAAYGFHTILVNRKGERDVMSHISALYSATFWMRGARQSG